MPKTLDIFLPLNESRPLMIYITVEYFVDPYKYYYLLSFHLIVTACLGPITILGTGMLLLIYGYHTCAMFKVAKWELEITRSEIIVKILKWYTHIHSNNVFTAIEWEQLWTKIYYEYLAQKGSTSFLKG